MEQKIRRLLEIKNMTVKEIIKELSQIKEEKIIMVITEWEKEQLLEYDSEVRIILKKKGQDRNPARF